MDKYNLLNKNNLILIYVILTIIIMIWAYVKNPRTPNSDPNKLLRLINLLYWNPFKLFIIIILILIVIDILQKGFFLIFEKDPKKNFPPAFLYLLNYGPLGCLIIYALFPQFILYIIFFYFIGGIFSFSFTMSSNSHPFPFVFKKHIKEKFEKCDTDDTWELIFCILLRLIWFSIIFLGIIFTICMVIPFSYLLVFIYTLKIPIMKTPLPIPVKNPPTKSPLQTNPLQNPLQNINLMSMFF